jgi:hypothetical protein
MRKLIMMIMAVALMALPVMAQDWQSTSAMQGSGSAYSAQVTAVGAAEVSDMATTTEASTSNRNKARRAKKDEDDWGDRPEIGTGDEGSPIGDAVLPLFLLSCAYLGFRLLRTRKRA